MSWQGSGRWAALSFGARHSVGVSGDGEVYTWGRNDTAQLGHNALQQQPMPMRLSVLRGIDVKAISCGSAVRICLHVTPYTRPSLLEHGVAKIPTSLVGIRSMLPAARLCVP